MIKQLLVILKLILLTEQLCTISSKIPNLYSYPITLMNTNLNALESNYTLLDDNAFGELAIAIHQMDIMSPLEWNVTVSSVNATVVVKLRNRYVNWIKVSCIVWSAKRQDLIIGTAVINFNNNSFASQQEININRSVKNYDSSIAIAYLNGFTVVNNPVSIAISVSAYKVGNSSFGVNIQNANNITLSSISISYLIFSPFYSNFQFYSDNIRLKQSSAPYADVSQSIPETKYKFIGFNGVNTLKKQGINFVTGINQNYVLKISLSDMQVTLQYIYFLPSSYSCSNSCNFSIAYNYSCVQKCPTNTILINNSNPVFCKICPKELNQISHSNSTLCICEDGYLMDTEVKCLPIQKQKASQNTVSNNEITAKGKANQTAITFPKNLEKQQFNSKFSSTAQTASNPAKCSTINTELINGRCVCKKGYINLNTQCIAIVALGNPFSSQKYIPTTVTSTITAIKASSACSQNQQFSITLNKCICNAGYKMNGTKCVKICSNIEVYNLMTNSCICTIGYVRINGLCTICLSKNKYSKGNEICYLLVQKKYCRNSYLLSGGVCLSCSAIDVSTKTKDNCLVCQSGFIYNGVSCVCPYQIINTACVSPNCGNNKIEQSESCDDGNILNGDGCSSNCIIEQDYSCNNVPSVCLKNLCGNGRITGGEQCDDNNTIDGDGCSSLCLVQVNYTCVGCLSSCYKILVGNLSLVNITYNTNNVHAILQVPKNYTFKSNAFAGQFMQASIISKFNGSRSIYCQQNGIRNDRFNCLIIFPSGVPNNGLNMLFRYNQESSQGALIVQFKSFVRNAC